VSQAREHDTPALQQGAPAQDPSTASRDHTRGTAARSPAGGKTRGPASAASSRGDEDRIGAGWLVLLLPLACCGGPLLIGALAAAGGLVWGALGVGVAVVLGAIVLAMRRRTTRSCHAAPAQTRSTAPPDPTNGRRA
jgi:Flp pilus assembly protein TadB